ncbi:MAG: hypothetical protein ACOX83_01630 [Candidatus Spyradocola sp.]|jgi:phage tail-like protein
MDTYLVINRRSDFTGGLLVNLRPEGEGLTLRSAEGIARGCAYLPRLDSGRRDFAWTRLTLDIDDFEGMVRVAAFAADNDILPEEGMSLGEYLRDPFVSPSVKAGQADPLYTTGFVDGRDVLLGLRGRYLYLKIEIVLTGGPPPVLRAVRARLSGDHMLDYLPAVYARSDRDGFLFRYLSIFDAMVKDLEERIDHFEENLDFDKQGGEMLQYLASWVGVNESEASDETLRSIVRGAVGDYERAQTPEGLKKRIARMTGHRPFLVEHFQVEPMQKSGKDAALYTRLFGTQENVFHILLPESCFPSQEAAKEFLNKISQVIPADTEAELVPLKDSVYLDTHTYLGVNSVISGHTGAAIDRKAAIQYDTVIGGEQN